VSALAVAESLPLRGRYACVDLETTGADPERQRIIEVGIVIVDDGQIIEEWCSLVDPDGVIPERIAEFTGITNDMVASAPTFVQLADEILAKCQGAIFAAHNARFDFSFLRSEFARAGRSFDAEVLCTVKLSRRLQSSERLHNLDAVIERYALTCAARHRALPDARAVADFLIAASERHPAAELQAHIDALLHPVALPPQLSPALLLELPEAPGAFRFMDAAEVLFVGHASNLKAGVLNRLTRGPLALKTRVSDVQWACAGSDWSARLIEQRWLHQHPPTLQRRRSNIGSAFTIRIAAPDAGVQCGVVPFDVDDLDSSYGFFPNERVAQQFLEQRARKHQLCLRVLGLDAGDGSCLRHHSGECKGACIGREPLALHYARALMAFAGQGFSAWRYPARAAFTERGRSRMTEYHVFDRWCYVGGARSESELADVLHARTSLRFDFSIYKMTLEALQRGRIEARLFA
jgi:DNA polymerase-3 subunit epsilon